MLTVSIFSVRFSGTTGANRQVHDILFVEKPAFFVAHIILFDKKQHMFPDISRIKCCQRSLSLDLSPFAPPRCREGPLHRSLPADRPRRRRSLQRRLGSWHLIGGFTMDLPIYHEKHWQIQWKIGNLPPTKWNNGKVM